LGGGRNLDEENTRIVTAAHSSEFRPDERVRCLELIDGSDIGRRFVIGPAGAKIGRIQPAEIALADSEVSRAHCQLSIEGEDLIIADLNSTNGTFIDGVRVREPKVVPVGAVLRVGRQSLKFEWRTQKEILQSEELNNDLMRANSYVQALLPEPILDGAIRVDWYYEPSAKLAGDAFGYGALSDDLFAFYMMDVSGHGAGAAMHSVTVMNLLRQRALHRVDMTKPVDVVTALNAMFPMESHAGMYFTMWYGVFDARTRRLEFASAGHHPGYLVPRKRTEATPMRGRGTIIGADPASTYTAASIDVPQDASIYLFSDGVFEIVTIDGLEWSLKDFVPLLLEPRIEGLRETQRLYREVRRIARPNLDDDFSLMVLTFA
jgi:serine phosphatase RsbU (regulator of sigma subunit)